MMGLLLLVLANLKPRTGGRDYRRLINIWSKFVGFVIAANKAHLPAFLFVLENVEIDAKLNIQKRHISRDKNIPMLHFLSLSLSVEV